VAAARWRTLSFWQAGNCIFQSIFSKPLDGEQGPATWPLRSPDLTPLNYYLWGHMKSLVYAVRSSTRAELMNHIMDDSMHINHKPSIVRSITSFSGMATMCIHNQGSHFKQLFH
jgi:hypothetical protein